MSKSTRARMKKVINRSIVSVSTLQELIFFSSLIISLSFTCSLLFSSSFFFHAVPLFFGIIFPIRNWENSWKKWLMIASVRLGPKTLRTLDEEVKSLVSAWRTFHFFLALVIKVFWILSLVSLAFSFIFILRELLHAMNLQSWTY